MISSALKKALCITLSVVIIPSAHADVSSRFSSSKIFVKGGIGEVANSNRFQTTDSFVFTTGDRAKAGCWTEDVGFPALLQGHSTLCPAPDIPDPDPEVIPPITTSPVKFRIYVNPPGTTFGEEGIEVSFFSNRENAFIYYTTDGSNPKNNPNAVIIFKSGHIFLSEDTDFRAIGKLNGLWSAEEREFYDYIEPLNPAPPDPPIIDPPIVDPPPEEPPEPEVPVVEPPEIEIPEIDIPIIIIPDEEIELPPDVEEIISDEGSVNADIDIVIIPGEETELHSSPSCPVSDEALAQRSISLFWMIMFFIMTGLYIYEKERNFKKKKK